MKSSMGVVTSETLIQPEVTDWAEPTKLGPFRKMEISGGICRQDLATRPLQTKKRPQEGGAVALVLVDRDQAGTSARSPKVTETVCS